MSTLKALRNPFNGIESVCFHSLLHELGQRIHSMELKETLTARYRGCIKSVGIHSMELKEHSVLRVLLDFIPFCVYLVSGI